MVVMVIQPANGNHTKMDTTVLCVIQGQHGRFKSAQKKMTHTQTLEHQTQSPSSGINEYVESLDATFCEFRASIEAPRHTKVVWSAAAKHNGRECFDFLLVPDKTGSYFRCGGFPTALDITFIQILQTKPKNVLCCALICIQRLCVRFTCQECNTFEMYYWGQKVSGICSEIQNNNLFC